MEAGIKGHLETFIKPVSCNNMKNIPNAWGHQRYEGKYLKVIVDQQKDVNNKLDSYGTIRDWVIRHIEGVKLKGKANVDFCKNCTCQDKY